MPDQRRTESDGALGRWTILVGSTGDIHGWQTDRTSNILSGGPRMDTRAVPVVPCDDAAVERAARAIDDAAMGALDGIRDEDPDRLVAWAQAALRAAGETS